jgi:hypothetical protein
MADRQKGYGLTAELQDKIESKYDPQQEAEVRTWMVAVVKEPFPAGSFHEALKDGVYLCKLINTIQPGSVKKVNTTKMAFKQMENIGNFLTGCENFGVPKTDLFQTVDLYEGQNIPQVITGISALARKVGAKRPDLPTIGPKEAQGEKREWTEAQLKEGQNVIGLQMGSNKGANQSGMTFGQQRQIH